MSGEPVSVPDLVEVGPLMRTPAIQSALAVPAVADAGDQAVHRFLEFYAATIRNKNTRMAYYRVVCYFFDWLEEHGIVELVDPEPIHVADYVETAAGTGRQADRQTAPGGDPQAIRPTRHMPYAGRATPDHG
jgi:hypothetical protein